MTSDRDLTRDGVAFARAVSMGDIDGAVTIYRDHDPLEFTVAVGGLLGGLVSGLDELGEGDPWGALVAGAERMTS